MYHQSSLKHKRFILHYRQLIYPADSLPRKIIVRTMNPLYLPFIQYSRKAVYNILDISIESGIDIPFAPLLRTPFDLLDGFVKYGVLKKNNEHYNVLSVDKNLIREAPIIIPEYEESALILRRAGYPYRGFILPIPWYYIEVFHINGKPLICNPKIAIDLITTLMTRIITVITSYGLNLLIFIDIDDKLKSYFSKPRPNEPWTWSLLIELLRKVISRSDAEKYGFMFCSKPSLLLIESLSSLPVDFISLNPSWYTVDELYSLYKILKGYNVYLAYIIDPSEYLDKRISRIIELSGIFTNRLKYLSTDCKLIHIYNEQGFNGIIEYVKQLPILVEKISPY